MSHQKVARWFQKLKFMDLNNIQAIISRRSHSSQAVMFDLYFPHADYSHCFVLSWSWTICWASADGLNPFMGLFLGDIPLKVGKLPRESMK